MTYAKLARRPYERKWYDNQFFDDGYHFRYWSRSANKIVDVSNDTSVYSPMRAIPKASKQIRGVANLLIQNDPMPVVYPEQINLAAYPPVQQPGPPDPQTGQPGPPQLVPDPELQKAVDENKRIAKLAGRWIEEEFKNQDIGEKIALMVILAAKHGVSFMQIWPDATQEKIMTQVYDAFDIYIKGDLNSIYDSPFLIKGIPKTIAEIKANELFDKDQLAKLTPDNRLASSEIKEAYLKAKQGMHPNPDIVATVTLKEFFLKEYLGKENKDRVRQLNPDLLKTRKDGDCIIRHGFVAGDLWLYDEYLDVYEYPFVEYRFEPGPIYQVPLIERFIPANKSLDVVSSRVERYINTMVTGFWLKKQGEQFKPTNIAGGVVYEYLSSPPIQGNIAPIPGFVFNFMGLLTQFIEEQGVTTSTLSKLPKGTRSNAAIESLKESENASLLISQRRLKTTVKKIAMKFLDIADNYFFKTQNYQFLEKGEPQYFDVIGKSAMLQRQKIGLPAPQGTIPLSSQYRVDIEVEVGLGFTMTGKRDTMMNLITNFFLPLAQQGLIPPDTVKAVVESTLQTFQFGNTAEFMETLEGAQLNQQQIQAMKVALLEVFNDVKGAGVLPETDQRIMEGKIATASALQDTGMASDLQKVVKPPTEQIRETINYKDAPPSIQRQMEQQSGFQPAYGQSTPVQADQQIKAGQAVLGHVATMAKGGNNGSSQPSTTQGK